MVKGRGVLLNRVMTPAEIAMLSGLAQVVQRIGSAAPLRYLTEAEVAAGASTAAYRYRELANASHDVTFAFARHSARLRPQQAAVSRNLLTSSVAPACSGDGTQEKIYGNRYATRY